MKRQIALIACALFLGFSAVPVSAQESDDLKDLIQQVYDLAVQGHEQRNPILLLQAAEILILHPEIQVIDALGAEDEEDSPNYFDALSLLDAAEGYTPIDLFKWRKKIDHLRADATFYQEMTVKGSSIQAKNFDLPPNSSKRLTKPFYANHKVILLLRKGYDLQLSVYNPHAEVLHQTADERECLIRVPVTETGDFGIEIANLSNSRKRCLLMIENALE
ncbi:MAG: hypothetical protein KDC44_09615 [Phaeodactylibacter sp.]|nr:hypothetical protein [Phaeodactylibacter sp.]